MGRTQILFWVCDMIMIIYDDISCLEQLGLCTFSTVAYSVSSTPFQISFVHRTALFITEK